MTALEEIETAIEKLTKLRDASTVGPWKDPDNQTNNAIAEDRGWWILNADEHGMKQHAVAMALPYNPTAAEDAELIVTLHRTIDAQLALLKHSQIMASNGNEVFLTVSTFGFLATALARAINGGTE